MPTFCAATAGAALILALIAVYRISDVVMGIMANPFMDMGYTRPRSPPSPDLRRGDDTLGAFVGRVLSMRFGVMRILMLGALLARAATCCLPGWPGTGTT